jgi:hypothetical protein
MYIYMGPPHTQVRNRAATLSSQDPDGAPLGSIQVIDLDILELLLEESTTGSSRILGPSLRASR